MKTILSLMIFVLALRAGAQVEAGTLIVLDSSLDEIVVAADSRAYSTFWQKDDTCKISAFGNELIFAASGIGGSLSPDKNAAWDTHTVAKGMFVSLSHKRTAEPMPLRLAKAWGEEVKKKLEESLAKDPKILSLQGEDGNILTSGLFAGFDGGFPLTVLAQVTYAISADRHITTSLSIGPPTRLPMERFLGKTDIAEEFFEQKTDRSRKWTKDLSKNAHPSRDPLAANVIGTVRISIENEPAINLGNRMLSPVGGPIDAVRLRRASGTEWIQRKPNCPAN
ncbi:hypothetical protein [Tunturiibacter lichenicola]|uniref:hypothetical protein n=1 Tax=Tunturiibacter lichenicola TaxID=2051959 RepID=UPI0021B38490|nr:hypothetical protein [Edaphobacter lichenicola]